MHGDQYAHPFGHQTRPPWGSDLRQPPVPPGALRVSDAERADVANALCRHFADGRLNDEELNERLAQVNAAKTRAELGPPLADLPRLDAEVGRPRQEGQSRREDRSRREDWPRRGGRRWSGVTIGAVAVLLVVWSTTGALAGIVHLHVPWVLLVVVAFVLLRRPGRRHRSRRRFGD